MQRTSRLTFAGALWVYAAAVLVQVFLAGLGVFGAAGGYEPHRAFGYLVVLVALALVPLAAVGRVPATLWRGALGLLALTVLQLLLIWIGRYGADIAALAALHPVNALVMFGVSVRLARLAWVDARADRRLKPALESERGAAANPR